MLVVIVELVITGPGAVNAQGKGRAKAAAQGLHGSVRSYTTSYLVPPDQVWNPHVLFRCYQGSN
jgi:hypothetical protein